MQQYCQKKEEGVLWFDIPRCVWTAIKMKYSQAGVVHKDRRTRESKAMGGIVNVCRRRVSANEAAERQRGAMDARRKKILRMKG